MVSEVVSEVKKPTFQSERLGAPPAPPLVTKTIGATTYRLFSWPDKSVRLTADTLIKEEGDTKTWKSREFNLPSIEALLQQPIVPPELLNAIKEIN